MAISIGDAIVRILGDDNDLQGKLQGVGSKLQTVGTYATAAGAVITGAFAATVTTFANAGDAIQKMALRTGFSTEALSEWKHAAELSGTSIQGMEKGVQRMNSFLEDAKDGMETSKLALAKLGLTIDDFAGATPEEAFLGLADAISQIQDPMERAALAQDVFGKSGTQLLPMFAAGKEGMASMRAEAHELGLVFSQEGADASALFNDNVSRLQGAFTGLRNAVAEQLIPILIPLVDKIKDGVIRFREWAEAHPDLFEKIVKFTALVGVLLGVFGPIIVVLGTIVGSLGTLIGAIGPVIAIFGSLSGVVTAAGTVFAALASPIGIAIAAIVAIVASLKSIVNTITEYWDEIERTTRDVWEGIKGFFTSIFDGIKTLFTAYINGMKAVGQIYLDFFSHLWSETKRIWNAIVDAVLNPLDTIKGAMDKATGFFKNLFGASLWPDYFQNLQTSTETHFEGMSSAVDSNLTSAGESMDNFSKKLAETNSAVAMSMAVGGFSKTPESLEKVRNAISQLEDLAKKASPNMVQFYLDQITLWKEQENQITESLKNQKDELDDAYGSSWFPDLLAKGVHIAQTSLPAIAKPFAEATTKVSATMTKMRKAVEEGVGGIKPTWTLKNDPELIAKEQEEKRREALEIVSHLQEEIEENVESIEYWRKEIQAINAKHPIHRTRADELRKAELESKIADVSKFVEGHQQRIDALLNGIGEIPIAEDSVIAKTEKVGGAFDKISIAARNGMDKIRESVGGVGDALSEAGRVAESTALGTAKSFLNTAELISNSLLSIQLESAQLERHLFRTDDLRGTLAVLNRRLTERQTAAATAPAGGNFNVGGITVAGGGGSFDIASEIRRQLQQLQQQSVLRRNRS